MVSLKPSEHIATNASFKILTLILILTSDQLIPWNVIEHHVWVANTYIQELLCLSLGPKTENPNSIYRFLQLFQKDARLVSERAHITSKYKLMQVPPFQDVFLPRFCMKFWFRLSEFLFTLFALSSLQIILTVIFIFVIIPDTLSSIVSGRPRPQVTWWHGGLLLDSDSETTSESYTVNRLFIKGVSKSLLNEDLQCRATSSDLSPPVTRDVALEIYCKSSTALAKDASSQLLYFTQILCFLL
jgi:hypothetical protein